MRKCSTACESSHPAKAAPSWLVPAEVWKLCSADLMPHIQGVIKRYFAPGKPFLPDFVCFLTPTNLQKSLKIYGPLHYNAPLADVSREFLNKNSGANTLPALMNYPNTPTCHVVIGLCDMLHQLRNTMGTEWIRQALTVFADDFLTPPSVCKTSRMPT